MAADSPITGWLFPGQGSQYLGMGRELWAQPGPAVEIADEAERLSGFPLRRICLQGPAEELTRTDVLQPALTAVALAAAGLLRAAGFCPAMVAGHSLGEFAALHAAGVLSISDCLKLVSERGRLMQQLAQRLDGGMGAVKRIAAEQLAQLISRVDEGLCIANFNSPEQLVVSGSNAALQELASAVTAAGGEYVPLQVAGPWHNRNMAEAATQFATAVAAVTFSEPECPVFMNVTGSAETEAARIKELVCRQMTSPVLWQTIVEQMFARGAALFLEVGPGKVLRGLMRRIIPDESRYKIRGIESSRSLQFLSTGSAA